MVGQIMGKALNENHKTVSYLLKKSKTSTFTKRGKSVQQTLSNFTIKWEVRI